MYLGSLNFSHSVQIPNTRRSNAIHADAVKRMAVWMCSSVYTVVILLEHHVTVWFSFIIQFMTYPGLQIQNLIDELSFLDHAAHT
jgi:hypothetical protein